MTESKLEGIILDSLRAISNNQNIESLDPKTNLFRQGILDSLSMVQFIVDLETKLKINFDYKDFQFDNFESVSSIKKFISDKTSGKEP